MLTVNSNIFFFGSVPCCISYLVIIVPRKIF